MLNRVSNLLLEIVCSVVATVIGSYVANHYIAGLFARDKPASIKRAALDAGTSRSDALKVETIANVGPSYVVSPPVSTGSVGSRIVDIANAERVAQPADRPAEPPSVTTRQHRPPREKRVSNSNAFVAPDIISAIPDSAEMSRASLDRAVGTSVDLLPGAAPTPPYAPSHGLHFASKLFNPIVQKVLRSVGHALDPQRRALPDDVHFSSRELRFQPETTERSSSDQTTISSDAIPSDRPGTKLARQWP